MLFPRNGILSIWLCVLTSGCASFETEIPPEWVFAPQKMYSVDHYLIGLGEGQSRDQAEKRAYASVARIFSAKVQAKSLDHELYTIQERNSRSTVQRDVYLDQHIQVTTTKLLENVHVLESWYRKTDHQFFVLAGLDRRHIEKVLVQRLRETDRKIQASLIQGRTHSQKIERVRGYKHALRLLSQRMMVNADLQVIRVNAKGVAPPVFPEVLQKELQEFVSRHMVIEVVFEGENHKDLEKAILEEMMREGLVASVKLSHQSANGANVDVMIVGIGRLWTMDLPDPSFRYVRWCGDAQVQEMDSKRLLGVISRTGREGHITEQEARIRASHMMQKVISKEVVRIFTQSAFDKTSDASQGPNIPKACPQ